MQRQTILVADDESLFRTSVVDSLRAHFPAVRILDAADGAEALVFLRREVVDVLVTDLQMPTRSGLDLVAHVAVRRLPVQIIVVSAHVTNETRASLDKMGALACLDKPIDLPTLLAAVGRMLQVPRSRVSGVTIAGFVQLLQAEQQSCALKVTSGAGSGILVFERGELVDARTAEARGDAAAMQVFSLPDVAIEVLGTVPVDRPTITRPLHFLLLESARFRDEGKMIKAPPRAAVDPSEPWETLNFGLSTMPPDVLEEREHEGWAAKIAIANLQPSLDMTMEIEGALGTALVDCETGATLGSAGGGPSLDLGMAVVEHAELVRAKRRLADTLRLDDHIEDILITTSEQYHLIRPLRRGGAALFLLVIIDRKRGNLGLARHRLARVESELAP